MNLLFRAILFTALVTLPLVTMDYFLDGQNPWKDFVQRPAEKNQGFCERNHWEAFTRELTNSWSNMAYVFLGFICLQFWKRDKRGNKTQLQNATFGMVTGLSLLYLGLGSFFYHASLTRFAQRLDMGGTYAVMVAVIGFGLFSISKSSRKNNTISGLGFFVTLIVIADILFYIFKWKISSNIVLPTQIVITIVIILFLWFKSKQSGEWKYALGALLSVITAFVFWVQDRRGIWCNPDSLLQGHAFWHLLTGLSVLLMYLYYRHFNVNRVGQLT